MGRMAKMRHYPGRKAGGFSGGEMKSIFGEPIRETIVERLRRAAEGLTHDGRPHDAEVVNEGAGWLARIIPRLLNSGICPACGRAAYGDRRCSGCGWEYGDA